MPDVKVRYINITTDMFDDAKIKLIRKMPEGDAIINVWIQLICIAGQCNKSGDIKLTGTIAYTDEMLATVLERDLPIVRLAINTLRQLQMIEWENGQLLFVTNFEKHQNKEGLEHIRALNNARQKEYYYRQKQLQLTDGENIPNVRLTLPNALNKIRGDNIKENNNIDAPIFPLKENEQVKVLSVGDDQVTVGIEKKLEKKVYGEFKNVKLTDLEYEKLKELFEGSLPAMIENLSCYIESKGAKYKSHYATILAWDRKDSKERKGIVRPSPSFPNGSVFKS